MLQTIKKCHNNLRDSIDAQLLAQVGIEGFEERLIEVRRCFALVELGEEGGAVHPVERGGRPVGAYVLDAAASST